MRAHRIPPNLPQNTEDKRGQESGHGLSAERQAVARAFNLAVAEYDAAKQAAADLEVDEAYLHHMRRGSKPVNVVHVKRLKPAARRAFLEAMAADDGLNVAPMISITREQVLTELVSFVFGSEPLRKMARRDIAERLHATEEEVERAVGVYGR